MLVLDIYALGTTQRKRGGCETFFGMRGKLLQVGILVGSWKGQNRRFPLLQAAASESNMPCRE